MGRWIYLWRTVVTADSKWRNATSAVEMARWIGG